MVFAAEEAQMHKVVVSGARWWRENVATFFFTDSAYEDTRTTQPEPKWTAVNSSFKVSLQGQQGWTFPYLHVPEYLALSLIPLALCDSFGHLDNWTTIIRLETLGCPRFRIAS